MKASLWIRGAVVYALVGVALGVVMGASHDFVNRGVHVHAHLVGWVSMALFGLIYRAYPAMQASRWASVHFYLHNLGLPVMLVGLYALLHQIAWGGPVTGIASLVVALAYVCFAVSVWCHAREAEV